MRSCFRCFFKKQFDKESRTLKLKNTIFKKESQQHGRVRRTANFLLVCMQTCEVWQLKPLLPGSRVLEHNRTSERRRGEGVIVTNSDDLPDGIDLPEKTH
jgi:hypothetical protein